MLSFAKTFKMKRLSVLLIVTIHILFWLFNYWLIAFATKINWTDFTSSSGSLGHAYTYGLFFNAVLFYTQVFWLFPKMYSQHKKAKFYVASIIIIIIISLIETYFDYRLYDIYKINTRESLLGSFTTNSTIHILYSIFGFYYILKFELRKSEKINRQLLEETYKTELKYLKAQLNPHFLFNGINSVYHLIGKDDSLAKETLLQFSGLLRYQLYESNSTILLEKELDYVLKYVKIEETRKGSDIYLDYDIKFENSRLKITPLLLIPFIENTFKHCSNHIDGSKNIIKLNIEEVGGKLTLSCINSFDSSLSNNKIGGVGLQNVKRRLSLLYPDAHTLDIKKEVNNFIVNLSINLKNDI